MKTAQEQVTMELEVSPGPATVSTDQIIRTMDILGKRIDKAPVKEKGLLYQRINDLAKVIHFRGRLTTVLLS